MFKIVVTVDKHQGFKSLTVETSLVSLSFFLAVSGGSRMAC